MEVWGGRDASIVLAGFLEILGFLAEGRLFRTWETGMGGPRFLGAGVGTREGTGGIFGRVFLGVRGFGGMCVCV